MSRVRKTLQIPLLAILALWAEMALADWETNLTQGVTEISREVYWMHMAVMGICAVIGLVVFGVMAVSIIRHRKSRGVTPATFHENIVAEVIWTVIPFAILIGMAIPAAKALIKMEDTSDADLTLKITGYQWKWEYEYLDKDVRFFSNLAETSREAAALDSGIDVTKMEHYLLEVDNPVVLPVGKKIRFLLTSNDVIHAWWIPEFAVKKDAIPGFINQMWTNIDEPGTYRGQCAELCGKDHGYMPVVVEAVSEEEFDAWILEQQELAKAELESGDREWALAELMERGEKTYQSACAACHQPTGTGIPGAFPALAGNAEMLADLDGHIDTLINGRAGTAMQAFGSQLSDVDIAAVVTYARNAWGNDTGDVIQPSQIKDAR
ncbi:MAG: cytochrome c oxidase subunit II [Pseudomonadota bacterium]